MRDVGCGLPENFRILKILAGEKAPLGIAHDGAIAGVHDDPAAVDENLGDHMFCIPFGGQQEQAANLQTSTPRKIQEGVGGATTNLQELVVVEGVLRIAGGKDRQIRCIRARRPVAHPTKDGIHLFHGSG